MQNENKKKSITYIENIAINVNFGNQQCKGKLCRLCYLFSKKPQECPNNNAGVASIYMNNKNAYDRISITNLKDCIEIIV